MCISPSITAIRRKTRQNTGSEQSRGRPPGRPSCTSYRIADGNAAALCRPHTPCRGAACRSRQCTPDSYWLPLKWYTPIASVAALSERLVHLQIMQRKFIGMRLPSLSLRGPEGAVAISSNRLRFRRGLPVIQLCTARLPRRFAPRNDTSRSMTQGTVRCTEMAVLLPLRGRARHASPLRFALHSITKNCRTRVGAAAERISYLLRAR